MVECPECGSHFKGQRGLSLHCRAAHSTSYHAKQTATIGAAKATQSKRRWDREEIAGMTCEEARLCRNGVASRNFNSLLVAFMPDRTREAIKGQRRHQDYISLVKSYMPEMDGVVVPQRDITHRPPHIASATAPEPAFGGTNSSRVRSGPTTPTHDHSPMMNRSGLTTHVHEQIPLSKIRAYETDAWKDPVLHTIFGQSECADICPHLLQQVVSGQTTDGETLLPLIDNDLLELLPPVEKRCGKTKPPRQTTHTKQAERRADYARVQALYLKNRTECARIVLAGKWSGSSPEIPMAEQLGYWKPQMVTASAGPRP